MTSKQIIAYHPRGGGYTNWILNSAIDNPNVIIVCMDERVSRNLERDFHEKISNLVQYTPSKIKPMFISLHEYGKMSPVTIKRPVVFDNSCFCDGPSGITIQSLR